jgi:hypothetical protein
MINYWRVSALLVLASIICGCARTETEIAPWNQKQLPAVICILSPTDSIKLFLLQTSSASLPASKVPYPDAKVYIGTTDSSWHELKRLNTDTSLFVDSHNDYAIQAGKTYLLRIEINGNILSAQTSVPAVFNQIDDVTFTPLKKVVDFMGDSVLTGNFDCPYTLPSDQYDYTIRMSMDTIPPYETGKIPTQGFHLSNISFRYPWKNNCIELLRSNPEIRRFKTGKDIAYYQESLKDIAVGIVPATLGFKGVIPPYSNITNGVGIFSSYSSSNKIKIRLITP